MGVVVPHQRRRATLPQSKRPAAPVVVTYQCPTCGQPHRSQASGSGVAGLDERALHILRANALDELAAAVRAGAEDDHVRDVLAVVERCEARLSAG